uniref:Uncharacterized protein n=1 Tax=Desertifilum tharense IPPAS B-1220 TaxID=1781255 RepID=A0ACD5H3A8_9CYAN
MGNKRELGVGSWGLGEEEDGGWGDGGNEGKLAIVLDIYSELSTNFLTWNSATWHLSYGTSTLCSSLSTLFLLSPLP